MCIRDSYLRDPLDRPSASSKRGRASELLRVNFNPPQLQLRGNPSSAPQHVPGLLQKLRPQRHLARLRGLDVDARLNLEDYHPARVAFEGVLGDTERSFKKRPVGMFVACLFNRSVNRLVVKAALQQPADNDRLCDIVEGVQIPRTPLVVAWSYQAVPRPLPDSVAADSRQSTGSPGSEDSPELGTVRAYRHFRAHQRVSRSGIVVLGVLAGRYSTAC